MALKLLESGYTQVFALAGGWKEWQAKGYPVEAR